jgi:hypothetical protein
MPKSTARSNRIIILLSGPCKPTCLGYLAEAPSFPARCLLRGFARPRLFEVARAGSRIGEPTWLNGTARSLSFRARSIFRCPACGGCVDGHDLGQVFDHEGPLPHPADDWRQRDLVAR